MEKKLKQYADSLPQPSRGFPQLSEPESRPIVPHRGLRMAALTVLLCLIATACVRVAAGYSLWSGIQSSAYGDVKIWNWRYDYEFPETMWDLPFTHMSTYYGAPQGVSHLEAMLAPTYTMYNVDYGDYQGTIQSDGTVDWVGKRIDISFGTTKIENWKYHFSVAEDGSCNHKEVLPDSQSSLKYEGYTLYLYTVGYPSVRWEDTQKQLVIDITLLGAEYDGEVVDIAKALIDLNMEK